MILVEINNGEFRIFHRERISVRIGKDGISNGFITDGAQERAFKTIKQFKEIIDKGKVEQIYATATSAIRNARNGKQLVDEIRKQTGIEAQIISGHREAELIYYGVTKALKIGKKPALIMDIGGGSIEFIIGADDKILWKESYEIGGQRMMERFHKNDPITQEEIEQLHDYLSDSLEELKNICIEYRPSTLIGSSGTFDTLSEIHQLRNKIIPNETLTEFPLTVDGFNLIYDDLIGKNREQRMLVPGMISMRVDMIVVAIVLVKYIIDTIGIDDIRVSAFALKEGVLLNTIDSLKPSNVIQP